MTANQMAEMFLIEVDRRATYNSMGIEDDEISRFLNDAVLSILKDMIREGVETTEYNRGFVANLKKDSWQIPINNVPIPAPADYPSTIPAVPNTLFEGTSFALEVHPNGKFWTYPRDLFYSLKEYARINKKDCLNNEESAVVKIKPISEDYYLENRNNSFRKPYYDGANGLIWRLDYSPSIFDFPIGPQPVNPPNATQAPSPGRVELITDGKFNVLEYHVRYLKRPVEIKVDRNFAPNQVVSDIRHPYHEAIVLKAAEIALENIKDVRFQSIKSVNN